MHPVQGYTQVPPSAPELAGEEGRAVKFSYQVLYDRVEYLNIQRVRCREKDFTYINADGARAFNQNNPYVAELLDCAEQIDRFYHETLQQPDTNNSHRRATELRQRIVSIQTDIYNKAKPSNRCTRCIEETDASCIVFCERFGCQCLSLVCMLSITFIIAAIAGKNS